jgi:hypothetical protein
MKGDSKTFTPLPIPDEYKPLAQSGLDVSAQDLAYLYAAFANDRKNGTSEASSFKDAVRLHELIDEIYRSSEGFFKQGPCRRGSETLCLHRALYSPPMIGPFLVVEVPHTSYMRHVALRLRPLDRLSLCFEFAKLTISMIFDDVAFDR